MYWRYLTSEIKRWSSKQYVQILFGSRQTGKSTLLRQVFANAALWIDLSDPAQRTRYLARSGEFVSECKALPRGKKPQVVVVDEAQTVPALFDAVQSLYDSDKKRWHFVLCGSSARKLRATGANLLPGRSVYHHLYSLSTVELGFKECPERFEHLFPVRLKQPAQSKPNALFPSTDIETRIAFGELPGIVSAAESDKSRLLKSYAQIYLEEEIRRESLVKDWGAFTRFLQLAAAESGCMINFSAISKEAGISVPTVKSYYQLLEDMFIGFRVPAFSKSPRKYLLATPEFIFFDTGVCYAAAGGDPGRALVRANPGLIFEQWVGQELWKRLGYLQRGRLFYYRTKSGAEIDFIVEIDNFFIPVEVKWTEHPTAGDARHLIEFIKDMPNRTKKGFIVCRCERPMQVHEKVMAIPYWNM